jgi:hypothetical protein
LRAVFIVRAAPASVGDIAKTPEQGDNQPADRHLRRIAVT